MLLLALILVPFCVTGIAIPEQSSRQELDARSSFSMTDQFNDCINPQNTEKNLVCDTSSRTLKIKLIQFASAYNHANRRRPWIVMAIAVL